LTTLASFWDQVDRRGPAECWPWKGKRQSGGGYGMVGHQYAHRIALEIGLGRPLDPSEWSLHSCDNPPCVNPRHLSLGDVTANNRDMYAKGRDKRPRTWACPDCGGQVEAVCRKAGARCEGCAATAMKAKRRRAYEAWRRFVPLKDPTWRSRRHDVCPRGHPMAGDNLYAVASGVSKGRRMCRACTALRKAASCQRRADPLTVSA
jgi:hypothetical protein